MRIKALIWCILFITSLLSAEVTDTSNQNLSINITNENITIEARNSRLGDVLSELASKSKKPLVMHGKVDSPVNVFVEDVSFEEALEVILHGSTYTYGFINNMYIIAEQNVDTLLYKHLIMEELYDNGKIENLSTIPIPLINQDLITDELVVLKNIRAEEAVKTLPKDYSRTSVRVDQETNALLLTGTRKEINRHKLAINAIDIPRKQIQIEVLFVEYSENMNSEIGLSVESYGNNGKNGFTYPGLQFKFDNESVKKALSSIFPNTNIDALGSDFYARLQMLISDGKANILAKPSISVINGHEATVSVDETQYFSVNVLSSSSSEQLTQRLQPIKFGIRLKIKPVITGTGVITAILEPEISDGKRGMGDYPDVSTRKIKTEVQIEDGKTLILGGLIRQKKSKYGKRVPVLGSIPIIGALFRSSSKAFYRTNLVIYITPKIIETNSAVSTEHIEKEFESNKYHRLLDDIKDGHR